MSAFSLAAAFVVCDRSFVGFARFESLRFKTAGDEGVGEVMSALVGDEEIFENEIDRLYAAGDDDDDDDSAKRKQRPVRFEADHNERKRAHFSALVH